MDKVQRACDEDINDALANHHAAQAARLRRASLMHGASTVCFGCDEDIKPERLDAEPGTRFCIACAREMEDQMKRERKWI